MYVSCKLKGGLGNQLFQIFTTINYCLENNSQLVFLDCDQTEGSTLRHTYWNTLFKNQFKLVDESFFRKNQFTMYMEPKFQYNILPKFDMNVVFNGYFQSSKYFLDIRDKIITIMNSNKEIAKEVETQFNNITSDKPLVSLHVRRTDYVKLNTIHHNQSENYYKHSIYIIKNKLKVNSIKLVVFSDDIPYCEENIMKWIDDNDDIIYIKNNTDYVDLLLMSKFKYNIIANSSFSWWGAYLNNNIDKLVIAPLTWFGPNGQKDWNDIYCKDWIKIKD